MDCETIGRSNLVSSREGKDEKSMLHLAKDDNNNNDQAANKFNELLGDYQSFLHKQSKSSLSSSNSSLGVSEASSSQQSTSTLLSQPTMSKSMIARYVASPRKSQDIIASCQESSGNNSNNNNNNNNEDAQANYELQRKLSSADHETIVGQCLDELVNSVSQQQQESPFESFKLHEAILAQTRSASATASSDDDDGREQGVEISAAGRADFVDTFQIQLGQWNEDNARKHSKFIKDLSRQFYLEQKDANELAHNRAWSLRVSKHEIKWMMEKGQSSGGSQSTGCISSDQIVDCLSDERLLIWIAQRKAAEEQGRGANVERQQLAGGGDGLDLDDIALALNEPISGGEQKQAALQVIVWSCASSAEATRMLESWQQNTPSSGRQLKVSEMKKEPALDDGSAVETQLAKPSALFVLPLDRSCGNEATSRLQKSICAPVCAPRSSIATGAGKSALETQRSVRNRELGNGQQHALQALSREQQAERRKRQLYETISKSSGMTAAISQGSSCLAPQRQQESGSEHELQLAIQRSDSSIELRATTTVHDQQGQVVASGSWLNAASKMLSSSSSKIKTFKEEMIRLNQSGCQSLASVARERAKRFSMIINHSPAFLANEMIASDQLVAMSSRDAAVPPVRPRTSILKPNSSNDNEKRAQSTSDAQLKSILKKSASIRENLSASGGSANLLKSAIKAPTQTEQAKEKKLKSAVQQRSSAVQAQEDDESEPEEHAFNRLKQQRASCYDLSRLVTKELNKSEQNQFKDDTSEDKSPKSSSGRVSICVKSRQRRPPLLLDETAEQEKKSPGGHETKIKTTSSGSDGTVRAQVGAAHLRQSHSAPKEHLSDPRRRSILVPVGEKKSEFDPRSLRRLPKDIALILKLADDREAGAARQRVNKTLQSEPRDEHKVDVGIEEGDVHSSIELNDHFQATKLKSEENTLGKGTRLDLLRQSFNQKALSSMLRASLRAKPSADGGGQLAATDQSISTPSAASGPISGSLEIEHSKSSSSSTGGSNGALSRAEAIRMAEANLLAAKQLKQQAQKLKEQQKRLEQQQASIDSAAARLFQTQQQQQQQQQQQHQMVLSQQYTGLTRGQHYHQQQQATCAADPMSQLRLQMQQQQQIAFQRQHYQQMAFMSHHQSAHFLAHHHHQQLAAMAISSAPQQQHQQFVYGAMALPQPYGSKFPLPMPYSLATIADHHHQQFAPMSVNHHSSFNIVYAPAPPGIPPSQTPSSPVMAPILATNQAPSQTQLTNHFQRTKHSSLGASVRKTVRSFLHANKTVAANIEQRQTDSQKQIDQVLRPLKSVLRSKTKNEQTNNTGIGEQAFGSDGELADPSSSSSSDSSACSEATSTSQQTVNPNKSVLKKTTSSVSSSPSTSSLSSDLDQSIKTNSLSSTSSSSSSSMSASISSTSVSRRSSTLIKSDAELLRQQLMKCNLDSLVNQENSSKSRTASKRAFNQNPSHTMVATRPTTQRKNVTFSTELTSIL